MLSANELMARLGRAKMLILDVDGVLTTGEIFLDDSDEGKSYNALDGHGIRLLQRHGVEVGIITGRASASVRRRAQELGLAEDAICQGAKFKLPVYLELLARRGLAEADVVYVGDDLPDLPVMRHAGVGVAVATAHPEVLERADWVTRQAGGRGAVREVADQMLKARGAWAELMHRYLDDEAAMSGGVEAIG